MDKVSAIILAAGNSSRFGEKKQFKKLNGKPIWVYSLNTFIQTKCIDQLILVIPNNSLKPLKNSQVFTVLNKQNNIKLVSGGNSRKDSVLKGLGVVKEMNDIVCIHDAARPFVKSSYIKDSIRFCSEFDGAITAIPTVDTVKKAENQIIKKTIDRDSLWMAQTPQAFHKEKLLHAIDLHSNLKVTDESTLMELAGFKIKIIEGSSSNFKITRKIDWDLAKIIESEK